MGGPDFDRLEVRQHPQELFAGHGRRGRIRTAPARLSQWYRESLSETNDNQITDNI